MKAQNEGIAPPSPTDLKPNAVRDVSGALNLLLADMFALYMKTKNFHWHVSGPHFRDYHLLLDEQADQIFAATDAIAERVRKIGGTTLRSIGNISRQQRILDNEPISWRPTTCWPSCAATASGSPPACARRTTCATGTATWRAPAIENWIDEAEQRPGSVQASRRKGRGRVRDVARARSSAPV
jgi:starvation-inducible DNA-binding protein